MGRTLAIGDIHGCSAALTALLEAISPAPDDTIVTLGDYIDRGPDSRGVIDQLLALRERCQLIPLLGNHEVLIQAVLGSGAPLSFWLESCGGAATLASYEGRFDQIPDAHWDFFESCQRYHETERQIFLHANYVPTLALEEQPDETLFWRHLMRVPAPHCSGKRVFVGHTPQRNRRVLDAGHLVCIDTHCYGDGCLTAYDVENGELWQADKDGVLLAWPGA